MKALGSEASHRAAGTKSAFAETSAWVTIALITGAGLLHPEDPVLWFMKLGQAFAILFGSIFVGALITLKVCARWGKRCQGPRTKPAKLGQEIFDTARAI